MDGGSSPVGAIWSTVVLAGAFLLALSGYLQNFHHHEPGGSPQILAVIALVVALLSVISSIATVFVLSAERRRWPSSGRLTASRRLTVWSLVVGVLVVITASVWAFDHSCFLALSIEVAGLAMGLMWRTHDRGQEARLLLQLAAIDAASRPPNPSAITWSSSIGKARLPASRRATAAGSMPRSASQLSLPFGLHDESGRPTRQHPWATVS